MDTHTRKEELRRFPNQFIKCVKLPDRNRLQTGRVTREAFRMHFRDLFQDLGSFTVI